MMTPMERRAKLIQIRPWLHKRARQDERLERAAQRYADHFDKKRAA